MKALLNKLRKRSGKTNENAGGARARKGSRGLSTSRLITLLFVGVLVIFGATAGFTYLQFLLLGQSKDEVLTGLQTQALAAQLGSRVAGYADVVAAAGRDPVLVEALAHNDAPTLAQQAAMLGKLLPAVLAVHILPAGYNRIDQTSKPPLSYACLDLLHRAETQSEPPVEVHLFGGDDQHMDIVRPVVGSQGVVGSILVMMDAGLPKTWLQHLGSGAGGYLELQQGADANAPVLAAAGNSALHGAGDGDSVAVPGTSWRLTRWTAAPASLTMAERLAFFSVFGVAAAALIVGFMAMGIVISRIVRGDLVAVTKQAIDMVVGGRQHNFDVRLAESREVLTVLEQRLQPKQVSPDFAKAAAMREENGIVVDEGATGESELAPSVLFMDKDAVEVEEMAPPAADAEDNK